jgi:hypothetical protein
MRHKKPEAEQTGRMGYREPDEPSDGRPVISRRPFWRNESEEAAWVEVVRGNPQKAGEGPGTYIARLAAIAAGRVVPRFPNAARTMPRAYLGKAALQRRVAELEGQREPGSDDE